MKNKVGTPVTIAGLISLFYGATNHSQALTLIGVLVIALAIFVTSIEDEIEIRNLRSKIKELKELSK